MVTIKEAKDVSNRIINNIHPVISIILFGSVAREGIGTDLDILIVIDDKLEKIDNCQKLIYNILKNFYKKFAIDPFIVPVSVLVDYYSKGSPFLRAIFKEGRLLYMKDAVKEWIKQSSDELNMAEYLLQGKYFKGACFHAQQSIEKSIKASLLNKGWDLEKTHSVERLISIGEEYNVHIELSDEDIIFIDNIYRGRYPGEAGLLPLGEPLEVDGIRSVTIARRIFENILLDLRKEIPIQLISNLDLPDNI
ncbi:MAG: HEPN domain-containing protein [Candidatus Firestonebacteria bacterium]|nr:HEPN domain-containing protein [Candidatus Firestonebacteria bacterium]